MNPVDIIKLCRDQANFPWQHKSIGIWPPYVIEKIYKCKTPLIVCNIEALTRFLIDLREIYPFPQMFKVENMSLYTLDAVTHIEINRDLYLEDYPQRKILFIHAHDSDFYHLFMD